MKSTINDVIYRYSTDGAFRDGVQADSATTLGTVEGLTAEEREVLTELFTREADAEGFEIVCTDGYWFYPRGS